MFFYFKKWIPVKQVPGVLIKTKYRMQILFWITKDVYDSISVERMQELKMKHFPEHLRERGIKLGYYLMHGKTYDAEGNPVKYTRYKNSGAYYKRHSFRKIVA